MMQINSNKTGISYTSIEAEKKTQRLSDKEVEELKIEIKSFQIAVAKEALESFGLQQPERFEKVYADFQKTLEAIGYDGKPIAELSQEEAAELVAEEGIFGIAKTSERLSQFVLTGAGDDIEMLRAGRKGIIAGYKEAEAMWGGELPEISQKTLEKSLEQIDAHIASLGFSAVNLEG